MFDFFCVVNKDSDKAETLKKSFQLKVNKRKKAKYEWKWQEIIAVTGSKEKK